MEAACEIPLGSTAKLRKQSKLNVKTDLIAVKLLVNALRHVAPMDNFLPDFTVQPPKKPSMDDLLSRPVLIMTADEEGKQPLD